MSRIHQTIVSAVTPAGRAAISTIVVRGERAEALVQAHFRRTKGSRVAALPTDRIAFGSWFRSPPGNTDDTAVGEEVVVCRRGDERGLPNIEVHCHGGRAAREAILADLAGDGGHVVSWSDWVRSVAPSRTVAEAQLALAQTTTLRTAQVLLDQYQGSLQLTIAEISQEVSRRPDHAVDRLGALLETARYGLRLTEPWRVAIVGPPNVGKSCLTNAIVGYQRAIVHDVPGTTRDILTAATAIDGWPVQFADTAGLRTTSDPVEAAGVDLARETAKRADCVVLVFDASRPWSETCEKFRRRLAGDRTIIVQNKLDLVSPLPADRPVDVGTSALRGEGVVTLLQRISKTLVPDPPTPGQAVVFTPRQQELVQRAVQDLRIGKPDNALEVLSMMESLAVD